MPQSRFARSSILRDVVGLVGNVGAKIVPAGRQYLVADARAVDLESIRSQGGHIKARRVTGLSIAKPWRSNFTGPVCQGLPSASVLIGVRGT